MSEISSSVGKAGTSFNPFPGLRPFTREESNLFFGREGQSKSVLASLEKNRFVAVIGSSGSGKSSLIYCGVVPELQKQTAKKWTTVTTRPGSNPLKNLVESFSAVFPGKFNSKDSEALLDEHLNLSDWLKNKKLGNEPLLLIVDQFEEIFRFTGVGAPEDQLLQIHRFVSLIYSGAMSESTPIYIVLTMRSDFIGECAIFQNLTELINKSNYLIPQMTRDDFRMAIEGPIGIGGASIENDLVEQLLDEVGNNTDQLPVLQHSLMRTWEYWKLQNDPNKPISTGDYEAIGRMEKALSDHANEAFEELSESQRIICENIFKTLTEKGGDNRGVRRPNVVKKVADISRCTVEEIVEIAEIFRTKGRTFLTPYKPVVITEDTVIDISHESLMRIWDRLRLWVDEEASSVHMYTRLSEASEMFQEGNTGLWRPPDLQLALNWRNKQKPTATWGVQYNPAFERAMVYLDTSDTTFKKEEENKIRLQRRRLRITRSFAMILGGIAVLAMGLFLWTRDLQSQAVASAAVAIEQGELAKAQTKIAEKQKIVADSAATVALQQEQIALAEKARADTAKEEAFAALEVADSEKAKALRASQMAKKQERIAIASAAAEKEQRATAEKATLEAKTERMLSIAQSMAVKSEQMRTDTLLKGLLAYQAYSFNDTYEGVSYDPDIFRAAYSGLSFFKGDDYNTYKGHSEKVGSLVCYGNQVISGSSDGTIIRRKLSDKASTVLLSGLPIINKLLVMDHYLFCLTDNSIIKYDFDSKLSDTYEFLDGAVIGFFITQEGKFILSKKNSIVLTDDYKEQGLEIYFSDVKINVVSYDPQSSHLFAALENGQIFYWDNIKSEDKQPVLLGDVEDANWWAMKYDPERNILAAGTGNKQGAIYLWDFSKASQLTSLRVHTAVITGISFSSDGTLMAASSRDGSVSLWQMDDLNTLPIVFSDYPGWVTSVTFSSDDKYVISGGRFGDLKVMPTQISTLIGEYCGFLTRELKESEWTNYVGPDIPYEPAKCKD